MTLTKGSSECTIQQGYWYTEEVIQKAKKLLKVLKGAILSEIQEVKVLNLTKRTDTHTYQGGRKTQSYPELYQTETMVQMFIN